MFKLICPGNQSPAGIKPQFHIEKVELEVPPVERPHIYRSLEASLNGFRDVLARAPGGSLVLSVGGSDNLKEGSPAHLPGNHGSITVFKFSSGDLNIYVDSFDTDDRMYASWASFKPDNTKSASCSLTYEKNGRGIYEAIQGRGERSLDEGSMRFVLGGAVPVAIAEGLAWGIQADSVLQRRTAIAQLALDNR